MNKHVSPTQLGTSTLTPAERVEALIDAFVRYQAAERAVHDIRQRLMSGDILTGDLEVSCHDLDDAVMVVARVRIEVVGQVKILMAGGVFERCAEMLKVDAIGRV